MTKPGDGKWGTRRRQKRRGRKLKPGCPHRKDGRLCIFCTLDQLPKGGESKSGAYTQVLR